MLITEIYNGQGLGNQLACYATTRSIAMDKGFDFGIMNPHKFKCLDFMDLDFGYPVIGGSSPTEGAPPNTLPNGILHYFRELDIRHPNNSDIRLDDVLLNNINDNTKLDGVFQSEKNFINKKNEIKKWFNVKAEIDCYDYSDDKICIINFRGGEYAGIPDFFLSKTYWDNAVNRMLQINNKFEFVVVTDDIRRASQFFPNYKVIHSSIGVDYSIIKNAHYLILSNSSFAYFPTFTSETIKFIIAPKYWGRYNISDGYWSCGYNIYENYNYIDRDNNIFSYNECINEFENYKIRNKFLWS